MPANNVGALVEESVERSSQEGRLRSLRKKDRPAAFLTYELSE
jgi:hypothetical protein